MAVNILCDINDVISDSKVVETGETVITALIGVQGEIDCVQVFDMRFFYNLFGFSFISYVP